MTEAPTGKLVRFLGTVHPAWIGVSLLVAGVVFTGLGHRAWLKNLWDVPPEFLSALGEALMIAGLLALFVDPFLKSRLLRDASKSILVHMIGFDHEPELKARLEKLIFETSLYRMNCQIDCIISKAPSSRVSLELVTRWEIVNQSIDSKEYFPQWIFAEEDKPGKHCEFTAIIGNGEKAKIPAEFNKSTPGTQIAKGEKINIESRLRKIRYQFLSKVELQPPQDYYHSLYFVQPTIDLTVSVKAPEGWTVWVIGLEPKTNEPTSNQVTWHSKDILMPSDHIEIHWRGPKERQLEAAPHSIDS